ncbi:hypothetical protein V565_254320 [Rhizoctonia solani 123E]|uniref:Uncharacterized protein n=1 Tax=Rhizoctonia solani 123E TaxID=1423351 RepID=A0A074RLL2_9AGAM|nr:hypothetical protein V565_254320 [Rhizoctonia solani 123E]
MMGYIHSISLEVAIEGTKRVGIAHFNVGRLRAHRARGYETLGHSPLMVQVTYIKATPQPPSRVRDARAKPAGVADPICVGKTVINSTQPHSRVRDATAKPGDVTRSTNFPSKGPSQPHSRVRDTRAEPGDVAI